MIVAALLVIPLLIEIWDVRKQANEEKRRDFLLNLDLLAKNQAGWFDQVIAQRLQNLQGLTPIVRKPSPTLSATLQQVASREGVSTLFYQEWTKERRWRCVAASSPELVDMQNLFVSEMDQARQEEVLAFLELDPVTQAKEIYFAVAVGQDVLVQGFEAIALVKQSVRAETSLFPYELALITPADEIFVASTPLHTLKELKLRAHVQIPLKHATFSLLISASKSSYTSFSLHERMKPLWRFFLIILGVGGALTAVLTWRMNRPLRALAKIMDQVAHGDLQARYAKDRLGFEINALGSHFNQMLSEMVKQMELVKKERFGRELLAREFKIGHEIQRNLMPRQMPELPGLDMGAAIVPAREVHGDFYDVFVRNQELVIAVGDASDKGISACLYSLSVRSMLRSYATSLPKLDELIRSTNHLFCFDTGDSGNFVTAWVGIFDPQTHQLHFCSCGHPPALLVRKEGSVQELCTAGTALGVVEFEEVSVASVVLAPGDLLAIYSDGISEAQDAQGNMFGKQRLIDALAVKSEMTAKGLANRVLERVARFGKTAELHDDLTILILRVL